MAKAGRSIGRSGGGGGFGGGSRSFFGGGSRSGGGGSFGGGGGWGRSSSAGRSSSSWNWAPSSGGSSHRARGGRGEAPTGVSWMLIIVILAIALFLTYGIG